MIPRSSAARWRRDCVIAVARIVMRLLSDLVGLALHDQLAERHRGRAEDGDDR